MNESRTLNVERSTSTAHRLTHYDGVCGNIHGHNMKWDVTADIDMTEAGEDNMPVDLKTISDVIDETDHAILLNESEAEELVDYSAFKEDAIKRDAKALVESFFGDVIWFDSDPTCELVAQWMADKLVQLDAVMWAKVELSETDKYSITSRSIAEEWSDE